MKQSRAEFVRLAGLEGVTFSALCERFGISRKTGYKWLKRWEEEGEEGLQDQSRRPDRSPNQIDSLIEAAILNMRERHGAWGGRTISHVLERDQGFCVAPSTVNSVLKRHGLITEQASQAAQPYKRFEHPEPNDLWQIDFKGNFATEAGRCHPLTLTDDHSRYNLLLEAMDGEDCESVQKALQRTFEIYGLPRCINADNGPPWGAGGYRTITELGVWLIRLGIRLSHSRPGHPQTNGKCERFHRTLKAEVLTGQHFRDNQEVQDAFDYWRPIYNHVRPHREIGMKTPSQRFRPSPRCMPKALPRVEYGPDDDVRKVQHSGLVSYKGRTIRVYKALHGQPVALRPRADRDGIVEIYFCHQKVLEIDLTEN